MPFANHRPIEGPEAEQPMSTHVVDGACEQESRLLECPSCGLPAEITDRFTLGGAPRAVEHVKLVCVAGHWCTPPVDYLPAAIRSQ